MSSKTKYYGVYFINSKAIKPASKETLLVVFCESSNSDKNKDDAQHYADVYCERNKIDVYENCKVEVREVKIIPEKTIEYSR